MHEHLETLHEEEGPKHQQQATTTWNNKRNLGHTSSSDGEFFLKKNREIKTLPKKKSKKNKKS